MGLNLLLLIVTTIHLTISDSFSEQSQVQGCPDMCNCKLMDTALTISNCPQDPIRELTKMLPTYRNLTHLTVTKSKLSRLPSELSMLSRLSVLNLTHNNILAVPWDALRGLTHFKVVDLSFNQITFIEKWSFYEFKQLTELYLDNNNISVIELNVFLQATRIPSLQVVSLSGNSLSTIDSWPMSLAKDRSLIVNLENNIISAATNKANASFKSCRDVNLTCLLRNNKLTNFIEIFQTWGIAVNSERDIHDCLRRVVFDMRANPLVCDCKDYKIYKDLQKYIMYYPQYYDELKCAEPESLKDQNPLAIELNKFVCDIHVDCPLGCTCLNTPNQRGISLNCGKYYTKPELPQHIPTLPEDTYRYHLNFDGSNIRKITFRSYLARVVYASFSYNAMTHIEMDALQSLQNALVLHLDNNKLGRLPTNLTTIRFSPSAKLKLGNNRWRCDCDAVEIKFWLIEQYRVIRDMKTIICNTPESLAGKMIINIDSELFCMDRNTSNRLTIILAVGIPLLVICIFTTIIVIRWKKNKTPESLTRQSPKEKDQTSDGGKEFDIFVSYATEDETYVGEYLIPELEKRGFKICFHRVHFHGGKPIMVNISECIEKSKRTLVFFSEEFKISPFSMFEFSVARELDLMNRTKRLVTIKDTNLNMDELEITEKIYFKRNTYVCREAEHFWDNLLYTLPTEKLGVQVEVDVPQVQTTLRGE